MFTIGQTDGIKNRSLISDQLIDGRLSDIDIQPVGHVRRRKFLAVKRKQSKKNLLFTGSLGLKNNLPLNRFDALQFKNRRQGAGFTQQILIGTILDNRRN